MKRSFHEIKLAGDVTNRNSSVLMIANHISWWDGIWALYINERLLHRKFYFMMLEEQLRRHWYFQYTGGYSVHKNTRSVIESIDYTAQLLSHPGNLVLMFPQGNIHSMYHARFDFEKGIEKILQKATKAVQVVFMASFIDYFSNPKPALYLYLYEYEGENSLQELEADYNRFYKRCLLEQSKKEVS